MSARVGACRAATMLVVHEAVALASRIAVLRDRAEELRDDVLPALDEHAAEYGTACCADALEAVRVELEDVEGELLRLTSQRDEVGALWVGP